MDVRAGSATLANTSTSTLAAPARNRARAQPSTVAPDQNQPSAGHRGFAVVGHAEGALDIGGALGSR
jgi:hypothetical protein